ncbi:MAG: SWIM zinc finger family protein, partial [Gammaproteobacteria bacterium]
MKTISTILRSLTFDDLREWAGGKILNRGKDYVKRVDQLFRTRENDLVAWVTGSERYATSVRVTAKGDLESFCTCPYEWGPCKHAVAVILAAAERVKREEPIPTLDENDDLSLALPGDADDEDDGWEDDGPVPVPAPRRSKARSGIDKIVAEKSRDELPGLLVDPAGRFPEVTQHILETEQLASGQVGKLVRALRSEIRKLTAEQAWYNPWRDEGNLPDYSHLEEQLQALADQDHADEVLQLGAELWTRGNAQVEQSSDEGETALAIGACLETVMGALPRSSLSPPEQLLWVIDRSLEDDYSLLESAENILKRRAYTRSHWREVAETLETRLQATPKPRNADFSTTWRRERLLNRLLDAYRRAGWKNRTIPRLEAETDACRCYGKLVDALLAAGKRGQARQWCIHGYACTVDDAPDIAGGLQEQLRKMALTERRHDLVAAYRAQDFFARPSRANYSELRKAGEKAKCWPEVRAAALNYLETGQHPLPGGRRAVKASWSLPSPEVTPPASKKGIGYQRFPDLDTLIDIAILEKRLDDVVALYQRLRKTRRWGRETDKTVAQAVANTHPDVALGIWQDIVGNLIGQVKPKAYEEAAVYLRLMETVYARTHRLAA